MKIIIFDNMSFKTSSEPSRSTSLIPRQSTEIDKNAIGSLSVPVFINNFFDSFARQYTDDALFIDEITKAFWTFRDLVFDMKYESNNEEMYDVLFEKLKLFSDKKFNLTEKKMDEFNHFCEIYYCDLVSDLMYGKYTCDDAYDLSFDNTYDFAYETWEFSSF
jgi:hypothetical protein